MPYLKLDKSKNKEGLIKRLRSLGGTWIAEQCGFSYYVYKGNYAGHTWRIQSFSTIVDAEREIYSSEWQIICDGEEIRTVLSILDPVEKIREMTTNVE